MVLYDLCFVAGKIIHLCSKETLLTSVTHRTKKSQSSILRTDKILWFFLGKWKNLMLPALCYLEDLAFQHWTWCSWTEMLRMGEIQGLFGKGEENGVQILSFSPLAVLRKSYIKSTKIIHWEWVCLQRSQSVSPDSTMIPGHKFLLILTTIRYILIYILYT